MSIDDGGPAFPGKQTVFHSHTQTGFGPLEEWKSGMSLRDWLAGQYGPGLLVAMQKGFATQLQDDTVSDEAVYITIAVQAYKLADAMLYVRSNNEFFQEVK